MTSQNFGFIIYLSYDIFQKKNKKTPLGGNKK